MTFETDDVLRIDDLVFWGGEGEEGFFITPDGFEGWEDSPEVRYEKVERSSGHGEFDSYNFFEARLLVVEGECLASSAEELGEYGNRLRAALVGQKRAIVDYQGVQTYALGRQASAVKFRTTVPGRRAHFQFSMRFPNPRRYGPKQTFMSAADGRWAAYHRGNFDAEGVITVTGDSPGYTIGGPDSTEYKVSAAIEPGKPHIIELGSGQISVAGEVKFEIAINADTWTVPPFRQVPHRITPNANGFVHASMDLEDTYI